VAREDAKKVSRLLQHYEETGYAPERKMKKASRSI
jgi:hypothetical protein